MALPTTSPMQAAVAANELWKFQLRKENKAIVDRMDADRKLADSKEAELRRLLKAEQDKNAAHAAKILELENSSLTRDQWTEIQQILELCRAKRDAFFASGIMGEQAKAMVAQRLVERHDHPSASMMPKPPASVGQSRIAPLAPCPQTIMPMAPVDANKEHDNPTDIHYPNKSRMVATPLPTRSPQTVVVMAEPKANEESDGISGIHPPIRTQAAAPQEVLGRNRQKRSSMAIKPPIATRKSVAPVVKLPRLIQGNRPLDLYYNKSNEIFATLPNAGREREIGFVNLFLKGIQDTKTRDKVIAVMQQIHESTIKDGKPHILCEWGGVLEGLVILGLVKKGGGEMEDKSM